MNSRQLNCDFPDLVPKLYVFLPVRAVLLGFSGARESTPINSFAP